MISLSIRMYSSKSTGRVICAVTGLIGAPAVQATPFGRQAHLFERLTRGAFEFVPINFGWMISSLKIAS